MYWKHCKRFGHRLSENQLPVQEADIQLGEWLDIWECVVTSSRGTVQLT